MYLLIKFIVIFLLCHLSSLLAYDAGQMGSDFSSSKGAVRSFDALKNEFIGVDCEKEINKITEIGKEILKYDNLDVIEFFGGTVLARLYQPYFCITENNSCRFLYAIRALGEMKGTFVNAAIAPLNDLVHFRTTKCKDCYHYGNHDMCKYAGVELNELTAYAINALGKIKHPRSALPLLTYVFSQEYNLNTVEEALWVLMDIDSPDLFFMSGEIKRSGLHPYNANHWATSLDVWDTLLTVKGIERGIDGDIDDGLNDIIGKDGLYKRKILAILNAFSKSTAERRNLEKIKKTLFDEWCEYYTVSTKEIDDKYLEVALILSMKLGTVGTITCPRYVVKYNQNR